MQISIIDPGLVWHFGHNRQIDIVIAKELVKRGYSPTIYCHESYKPRPEEADFGFKIIPLFSANPYGQGFEVKKGTHIVDLDLQHAKKIREELSQVSLGDMCIAPTMWPYLLHAAADIPALKFMGCVHHNPLIGADLGDVRWRAAFSKLSSHTERISMCVVETGLQRVFDKLAPRNVKIEVVPFPAEFGIVPKIPITPGPIGILGGLRPDQGADHLPAVINTLLSSGSKVLLQDSRNVIEAPSHPGIEMVAHIDNIATAICRCDAMVLHYDPKFYGLMGSGLMWEALLHGIPVLYTNNTLPGKVAQRYGAGIPFNFGDIKSFELALAHFKKNRTGLMVASREAAHRVRSEHGVAKFVDAIFKSTI